MFVIVDYGVGNLANVERALRRAGARDVRITGDPKSISGASAVVLPGVGHFGHCARELAARGLDATVREAHARGVPLLGLCVGMQLLFDGSEEDPRARGLGIVPGTLRRMSGAPRVPHTGWNEVHLTGRHAWLAAMPDRAHFYFVHSYALDVSADAVVATTTHGADFASIVGGDGWLGVQFHPEKSSLAGTRLLQGIVHGMS